MVIAHVEDPGGALLIQAIAAHDGTVGDPAQFGPVAERLVEQARAAGEREAEVVALRGAAWYARSQLANRRARRLLDRAAALATADGLDHRLGEVLLTRAAVDLELGRVATARRDLARAGTLVAPSAAPDLALKQAALLHNLGLIGAAADAHRAVLLDPTAPRDVRTRAANNLALDEALLGRTGEALRVVAEAARLAEGVGPAAVAIVAHNRGQVLAQSGRLAEGLDQFDAALVLVRAAGLPEGEFLADHAETLADLRALPEALAVARRAAEQLEAGDVPLMAAQARLRVAQVALLVGDDATARADAEAARDAFRRQRRPGWSALATVVAVEAELRSGGVPRVVAAARAADTLSRLGLTSAAGHADLVSGRAALAAGRQETGRRRLLAAHARSRRGAVLDRLQGSLAGALAAGADRDLVLAHCRAGLADLARHRAALASMELRALAADHGVELGLMGLRLLLAEGRPTRVLDWVERTRAVALLTVDPPAPGEVREERAELAAVHADLVEARRGGEEPAGLALRQRAAEARLRRATWRRSGTTGTASALPIHEVAALLGDRALAGYVLVDRVLHVVVVHRGRRRLVRLGDWEPIRFEIEALLFALRRLTRPGRPRSIEAVRASADHAVRTLTDLLVVPLGVPPDVPLVVVPASEMHRVPWSALHAGPVSVSPSAAMWARTAARPRTGTGTVVVGGPGLPGVAAEVAAVAARHPDARVLGPAESTSEAVLEAMTGADLVHLACHGHLRADNPTFSALEIADGLIAVHELDLRGIAPRRVVLAACDSAADVAYAGDELVGFVSALLARGSTGIAASVVAVADLEAVELMGELHAGLAAGETMSVALHRARSLVDPADPRQFVNSCAFTAYGAG